MQAASSPVAQACLKQCLDWHVVIMSTDNSPDGVTRNAMPSTDAPVAVPLFAHTYIYLMFQVHHRV